MKETTCCRLPYHMGGEITPPWGEFSSRFSGNPGGGGAHTHNENGGFRNISTRSFHFMYEVDTYIQPSALDLLSPRCREKNQASNFVREGALSHHPPCDTWCSCCGHSLLRLRYHRYTTSFSSPTTGQKARKPGRRMLRQRRYTPLFG